MFKNILVKFHFTSRLIIGIVLFTLAIVVTGILEGLYPYKVYFPFTGMIILLLVSWFMYKIDRKNLDQLGLDFTFRNYKFLFFGLVIGLSAYFFATVLKHLITGQSIQFNSAFNISSIIIGAYYILPNAVVEELIYRGYLFKKVINKTNVLIANIVFSFVFMLVHVLDSQVLSSLGGIIMMVVTIPIGHLLFATALLKSHTILFPIGLHVGNNWATMHLLTNNQEHSFFYQIGNDTFDTWSSFIAFIVIWNSFYLVLTYIIWKWPLNKPS